MRLTERTVSEHARSHESVRYFRALIERAGALGRFDTGANGGFPPEHPITTTIARTPLELRAAAELVGARYAECGYVVAGVGAVTRSEITLIAGTHGAMLGTLTLRPDGPTGLRADESYREHIDAVRAAGGRLCELTRFAVAPDAQSKQVFASLFGLTYEIVRQLHRATDVFVEVNPRHAAFYRRLFGFAVAAGLRICPRVRAPSVLLRLELATLEARMRALSADAARLWSDCLPAERLAFN